MPKWNHTLKLADVFHNEDLTFEQRRDEIVRRIKAASFWKGGEWELADIVDEMADADTVEHFDQVWDTFYDWADAERVWVATF